jgi:hypothetical protein
MRKVFSILLAGLLLVSFNFTSSFATSLQKNDKSLSNSTAHLNNPHGKRTSENPVKPQSSRPDGNPGQGSGKKKADQLKSPKDVVATPDLVTFGNFTVTWASVNDADTYTVRVYGERGKTVLDLPLTWLSQTSAKVVGETATAYRVSVQAIGNGTTFTDSPESGKYSVTTYPYTFSTALTPTIVETGTSTAAETVTAGVQVRADSYTVTANTPASVTYTFKWETSTAINGTYGAIPGATHETFTATSNLADSYLRVLVTARANGYVETSTASVGLPVIKILGVGDPGPAGGVIFYYDAAGFDCGVDLLSRCNYLEVAPSGWSGLGTDPHLPWTISYVFTDIPGIVNDPGLIPNNTLIGRGFFNSTQIVNLNGSCASVSTCTYAAGATRAYSSTINSQTFSDWFLPNVSELNQLCKYVKGLAWTSDSTVCTPNISTSLGIQTTLSYWSSSEGDTSFHAWVQYMNSGSQFRDAYKAESATQWVRPIRAF